MTQISLAPRLAIVESKCDEMDKWINGNGQPGAKERLPKIEECQRSINEKMDDVKDSVDKLSKSISVFIGIIVTIFVPFAIWFFTVFVPNVTAHIQHVP